MQLRYVVYLFLFLTVTAVAGPTGCASTPVQDTAWPEPSPLGRDIGAFRPPLEPSDIVERPPDEDLKSTVVTLPRALSLALMKNPELAAFSWEVRAQEAKTLQVGLPPNPDVGIEIEEFAGSGERQGFDAAVSTLQLSQLIELGGKRSRRAHAAALERDLAGWDYEAKKLDVFSETTKAFVEVLAAQEQVSLATELVRLSEQVLHTVSERVKAGKVSPLEEIKSGVTLSNSKIELAQAKSNLEAARKRLSVNWGEKSPVFEKVDGALDTLSPIPSAEQLNALVAQNPDVARWVKEMEQRKAAVELEKAGSIPDITVSGVVQRFSDTDDSAFVIGISIPIPLFDRNQGGVKEARYRLAKAREEYREAEQKAGADLAEAYRALVFSHAEATSLVNDVLPAAQAAFDASEEGYREGKFDFLTFLDAQRTLFEAKGKYIDSLASYHKAVSDVERLTGERLSLP